MFVLLIEINLDWLCKLFLSLSSIAFFYIIFPVFQFVESIF